MTQAVNLDTLFTGIDDPRAKATDKLPKLPAMGEYLLEVTAFETFNGTDVGATFAIEHKVLESSRADVQIGLTYRTQITGLNHMNEQTRLLKQGKVRNFVAALLRVPNEDDPAFMAQAAAAAKMLAAAGRPPADKTRVRAKTGPVSKTKGGHEFVPVSFSMA